MFNAVLSDTMYRTLTTTTGCFYRWLHSYFMTENQIMAVLLNLKAHLWRGDVLLTSGIDNAIRKACDHGSNAM